MAAMAAASAGPVMADNVTNNVDVTADATVEVLPQNVGGADATVSFTVLPANGDGKNGCNITGPNGSVPLSVTSGNTGVATG